MENMTKNSLEKFIDGVGSVWGPLTSELVAGCRQYLEELVKVDSAAAVLIELCDNLVELFRRQLHAALLKHLANLGHVD